MISLELSTIQYNSLQSAVINAQIDEFLRRGGEISIAPPPKPVPRPYGRLSPEVAAVRRVPPKPKAEPGRPRIYDQELIDRIVAMAETMTCKQVSAEVDISVNKLHCLSMRNAFRFQPESTAVHVDVEKDMPKVERVKAFIELGISRRQAAQRMGISTNQLNRLVSDYKLDYPKCSGGKTWVMPA
jgi:hypothetical protein